MSNLAVTAEQHLSPSSKLSLVNIKERTALSHTHTNTYHSIRECKKNKMAQQGCESCQKWQEHYYQEHMDVIRFFKVTTGDFAESISIPLKFGNNLKAVNLKAPNGETWQVGVTKHADEIFFMSGWGDFASSHELQENNLLIFTRSGSYSFDVVILDASGCEKVSSFFIGKKDPYMHKHFDDLVGQQAGHCILSDSDDDTRTPLRLTESAHKASPSKKRTAKTKRREEPESPDTPDSSNYLIKHEVINEEEQSDDRHTDSNYYYSRSANILTEGERKKILSLASVKPGNPAFVTVLQKTHIGHKNNFLIIHSGFAADHLESRSHDILLLRPNREDKWYVKYYYGRTRGFNCRRWIKFVRDNRLRKDYICVFELMKHTKRTTMVVHVIRKVDGRFVLAS